MRRFIIAPSMARLIRRERGSARLVEGYFPTQATRNSHVRIDGAEGQLILIAPDEQGRPVEEITTVPRKPAEALLDVCAGRLEIERTSLAISGRELQFERISSAGRSIDIASVDAGADFTPPPWLGREIGQDAAFSGRALALDGIPAVDTPMSDSALDSLIDALDNRFGAMFDTARPAQPAAPSAPPPREPARAPTPAAAAQPTAPQAEAPQRRAAAATASARQEAPVAAQATAPEAQREQSPAPQATAGPGQEATPSKRMETIIQGLSKVLREPGLPAEGEAIVELDRWGGRRR